MFLVSHTLGPGTAGASSRCLYTRRWGHQVLGSPEHLLCRADEDVQGFMADNDQRKTTPDGKPDTVKARLPDQEGITVGRSRHFC